MPGKSKWPNWWTKKCQQILLLLLLLLLLQLAVVVVVDVLDAVDYFDYFCQASECPLCFPFPRPLDDCKCLNKAPAIAPHTALCGAFCYCCKRSKIIYFIIHLILSIFLKFLNTSTLHIIHNSSSFLKLFSSLGLNLPVSAASFYYKLFLPCLLLSAHFS